MTRSRGPRTILASSFARISAIESDAPIFVSSEATAVKALLAGARHRGILRQHPPHCGNPAIPRKR